MIGKTISHYKIIQEIGKGGMGEVYLAEDTELQRNVALKFLPAGFASDPAALERFRREARAAAALQHPNIVTIHEVGETEGRSYIVMGYVDGDPLSDTIVKEDLSLEKVLDVAIQACEGLSAAHEAGVVHRDVKPANIIIDKRGGVKILDFGLAKLHGVTQLTREDSTVGTVNYMSPEQTRGEEVDHRSDIFSLGAVIYEFITKKKPFQGEHREALFYSIANEDPQPLQRYNNEAPDDLQRIVSKALAKNAAERYQSVADMLVDLRALQRDVVSGTFSGLRSGGAAAVKKSRAPLLTAGVVLIAVLAAWYFFWPGGKAPAPDHKSIAVLPFENLSADPENEYFSDGITEDITAQLSKIADLRVISRTTTMLYKGSKKNLREIGKELDVAVILEGSVRRAQGKVRIVSQLIDVNTDEHIWAETYDRDLSEIFTIQSDVAEQIAQALKAKLTDAETQRIRIQPTESMEAYDCYLRGREYYYHYIKDSNEQAIVYFKKALEFDRDYALAYAGLGDAYGLRVILHGFPFQWLDESIKASKRAIELNPDLAEGYKALGLAYGAKNWFGKALEANLKAVEVDPNYAPALGNAGSYYVRMGRPDKAMPLIRKSMSLEKLLVRRLCGELGEAYAQVYEYEEARRWLNLALQSELNIELFLAYFRLIGIYQAEEDYVEAKKAAETFIERRPDYTGSHLLMSYVIFENEDIAAVKRPLERAAELLTANDNIMRQIIDGYLAVLYLMTGDTEKGNRLYKKTSAILLFAIKSGDESHEIRELLATLELTVGNKDEAMKWLQNMYDAGFSDYKHLQQARVFEPLRGDPGFEGLIKKMRVRHEEIRERVLEYDRSHGYSR